MITLTFILIAFCLQKRFVSKNALWSDKLLYYGFSVVLTPLLGLPLYRSLMEARPSDTNDPSYGVFPAVD